MMHEDFIKETDKYKKKLALSWYFDISYRDVNIVKLETLLKEHEIHLITKFFTMYCDRETPKEEYVRCVEYTFGCDRFKAYEICGALSQETLDKLYSKYVRDRLSEILMSIRDEERMNKE